MNKYHFWPEEIIKKDGFIVIACTIENPDQTKKKLWYKLPEQYHDRIAYSCNPFIVALIFKLMKEPAEVVVHGQVSPSLLRNLTEYQTIWQCWRPNYYYPVEINAEIEKEISVDNRPNHAISAFSGGVDSCFTIWQHKKGLCGRLQRNITTGLMIQGFDIPLSQTEAFSSAFEKSKRMLSSLDTECIPLSTNIRQFKHQWFDTFGAAVISCLMLFQKSYQVGLVPSSGGYKTVLAPWGCHPIGSHPIIDPLLSSNTFSIIHDGASFSRNEKIKEISSWKKALDELRVCPHGKEKDRNCGHCEKCVRTILAFRAIGVGLPECFSEDISNQEILTLSFKALNEAQIAELTSIMAFALKTGLSESWIKCLRIAIFSNQITARLLKPEIKKKFSQTFPKLAQYSRKIRGYN